MSDSVFQWVELGLKYSKTVVTVFVFLIGLSGYNIYGNFDKEAEIKQTQEQVANVAEYYYKEPAQVKISCDKSCVTVINKAIKNHERGRLH